MFNATCRPVEMTLEIEKSFVCGRVSTVMPSLRVNRAIDTDEE